MRFLGTSTGNQGTSTGWGRDVYRENRDVYGIQRGRLQEEWGRLHDGEGKWQQFEYITLYKIKAEFSQNRLEVLSEVISCYVSREWVAGVGTRMVLAPARNKLID